MRRDLDPTWFSCEGTLRSKVPRYECIKKVRAVLEVAKYVDTCLDGKWRHGKAMSGRGKGAYLEEKPL